MSKVIIKNGNIAENSGYLNSKDILIEHGKIIKISSEIRYSNYDKIINANKKIIIPGCIDSHVYIKNLPGPKSNNNWYTESSAAALSGITTIINYENNNYNDYNNESSIKNAKKKSIVDFGTIQNINQLNLSSLENKNKFGIVGFDYNNEKDLTNIKKKIYLVKKYNSTLFIEAKNIFDDVNIKNLFNNLLSYNNEKNKELKVHIYSVTN